jgi:hypothetical protein
MRPTRNYNKILYKILLEQKKLNKIENNKLKLAMNIHKGSESGAFGALCAIFLFGSFCYWRP